MTSEFKAIKLNNSLSLSRVLLIGLSLIWATGFLSAQTTREISVPFTDGFIGKVGNNPQNADSIVSFSTLGIRRAFFVQQSATGVFSAQGNDILLTLRLEMTGRQLIEIPGALVWRVTSSGNTLQVFGFLAAPEVSINLNAYGGANYLISGGTQNGKSNFGLKRIGATIQWVDYQSITGNAATSGLLDALNTYLVETEALRPAGPVTVNSLTTCSTTPTISGTATLKTGETLSVLVNGASFSLNNGVVLSLSLIHI